ncbi:hypothetical protein G432_20630 (plasmid) [Sphingomonas sp. MM-1]|uniref:hypothetical protein n=1 Tax=Sphingomonas sp. MM-1 TaxID=745310 RepID=UPI0002C10A92|nr:hypothetical protein [Sphingomonas sp. MM-1]AGH51808.1 hypothetical protein G432_20630 [Sphingomonas sp. MM-1]
MGIAVHARGLRRSGRRMLACFAAASISAAAIFALQAFISDWFGAFAVFGVTAVTIISMARPREV